MARPRALLVLALAAALAGATTVTPAWRTAAATGWSVLPRMPIGAVTGPGPGAHPPRPGTGTGGSGGAGGAGGSGGSAGQPGSALGGSWWSGAAGDTVPDGRFGTWRGEPVTIGGSWDDNDTAQVQMWTVCPGGPWANWTGRLDEAVGALDHRLGETWAAAAQGAYDTRWRTHLTKLRTCWGKRDPSRLYLRFAHEMNLAESPWSVRRGEERDFVAAITRYSALRYEILPKARIVLCPNDGTSGSLGGLDVRFLWPGQDDRGRPVADLYAVDSYNDYPHVSSPAAFTAKINSRYPDGRPLGLETHRRFAEQQGVPFAISEWANQAHPSGGAQGDDGAYPGLFRQWVAEHGGDPSRPKAGQVLYEVYFDLWPAFELWPQTSQPRTADAYRALTWGS